MDKTEGWGWLTNATKWHYFVNGRSLCGRWIYLGSDLEQGNNDSPQNCAECRKRLTAALVKARKQPMKEATDG